MKNTLILTLVLAGLAGCATLTPDQCKTADWLDLGRRDGQRGRSPDRIAEHSEACSKAGMSVNAGLWRQGWREGVRSYCVPRVAWNEGAANNSYNGACHDLDEPNFLRWYRLGQDVYKTRQQRDSTRSEMNRTENELKKAEKDEDRKRLREKLRQLESEQGRLRRLLETLESGEPRN